MPPTIQSKEVGDEARESWCRENWGCGETYEIDNEVGDEDVRVWLAFYTEGGSPEKALLEMAKRFPRLEFVILCSVDKAPPLSRWHLRAGKIVCQHYSGDLDEKGSRAGESRHERRRREKARRRVRGSRKFVYI
jgi:hypothetical protein